MKNQKWQLTYTITGKPVQAGDLVQSRGDSYIVQPGIGAPPHKPSSTGRIWVKPFKSESDYTTEYFPTVFDAKWELIETPKPRKYRPYDKEAEQKWIAENPEKKKAHTKFKYQIKKGNIIRPSECSRCDYVAPEHAKTRQKIQGHHPDYSKPLDVIWLCAMCHTKEHKRLEAEAEAS